MNTPTLEKLARHRDALLVAEVAVWLHMLGKYHQDFLDRKEDQDLKLPPERDEKLQELLTTPWIDEALKSLDIPELKPSDKNSNPVLVTIEEIVARHRSYGSKGIFGLIFDAHGRGSATEKGALDIQVSSGVFSSSPFGVETGPLSLIEQSKPDSEFYVWLGNHLHSLRDGGAKNNWEEFRSEFLAGIKDAFSATVADTRRPINDVTLFDQTFASVSFFKAVLARNLLLGWKDPFTKVPAEKYHWRFLRVGLNGQSFWGQTARLNDMLSRKDLLDKTLNKIRELLEVEYPFGMEIYRDQDGSVFVLPDLSDLDILSMTETVDGKTLLDLLQEIAGESFRGEAVFTLYPSSASRNMMAFGELVKKELPDVSPTSGVMNDWWKDETKKAEVCSVCGVRPQAKEGKAKDRKVCKVCEERRSERAKRWSCDDKYKGTIWMDEVIDDNGRFALIAAKFNLDHWLNGSAFNGFSVLDSVTPKLTYADFLENVEAALAKPNDESPFFEKTLKFFYKETPKTQDIYDRILEDTDLKEKDVTREAWRLVQVLGRLQPSPARIRRTWDVTKNFWQKCIREASVDNREHRLIITGDSSQNPGEYHAYELVCKDIRLPVMWDPQVQGFISVINLDYLAKLLGKPEDKSSAQYVMDWILKNETLKIEEPSGYGKKNKLFGELSDFSCALFTDSSYKPIIPVLEEPGVFMALVPANEAMKVAEKIKENYELGMSKVRNKLALQVGVIFAPGHTPLRAMLDAGWRMLRKERADSTSWQVSDFETLETNETDNPHFKRTKKLILKKGDQIIQWVIPLMMGDGTTEDRCFPIVYLERSGDSTDPERRLMKSICPWRGRKPFDLLHVNDLVAGDVIDFIPSTFDFQWLDSAARRFEIDYEENGKRRGMPSRPYLLGELDTFKSVWQDINNYLTVNQIYILRDLIENKREAWLAEESGELPDSVFWDFCKSALTNAKWERGWTWNEEKIEKWTRYAVSGILSDVVELHLHIMKDKEEIPS